MVNVAIDSNVTAEEILERGERERYESDGNQTLLKILEHMNKARELCSDLMERHPEDCGCVFCKGTRLNMFPDEGDFIVEISHAGHMMRRMVELLGTEVVDPPEETTAMITRAMNRKADEPAVV